LSLYPLVDLHKIPVLFPAEGAASVLSLVIRGLIPFFDTFNTEDSFLTGKALHGVDPFMDDVEANAAFVELLG
jgi:hypothetical protein